MAEKCTNTSSPVERWMNPYPFAPLNHFTVPFSLTKKLLSPGLRIILPSLFCLPRFAGHPLHRTSDTRLSLKATVRIVLASPRASNDAPTETAPLHSVERLPATKCREAAKTKARYPTADTETSILLITAAPSPTGPIAEAPDNSRKILIGKSEIAETLRRHCGDISETFLRTHGNEDDPGTNPSPGHLRPKPGVPRRKPLSI